MFDFSEGCARYLLVARELYLERTFLPSRPLLPLARYPGAWGKREQGTGKERKRLRENEYDGESIQGLFAQTDGLAVRIHALPPSDGYMMEI